MPMKNIKLAVWQCILKFKRPSDDYNDRETVQSHVHIIGQVNETSVLKGCTVYRSLVYLLHEVILISSSKVNWHQSYLNPRVEIASLELHAMLRKECNTFTTATWSGLEILFLILQLFGLQNIGPLNLSVCQLLSKTFISTGKNFTSFIWLRVVELFWTFCIVEWHECSSVT